LLEVLGCWARGNLVVIVTGLADGSLDDWLRRRREAGRQSVPAVPLLNRLKGASEALDFLHARAVFPNDVKPQNLLLVGDCARVDGVLNPPMLWARDFTTSMAPPLAGTPRYMAPEIWTGQPGVHADQYALAVTYFYLRAGRFPFTGSSPSEVFTQHLYATPDLGPLPDAEREPLLRALAKDPQQRFPSCRALVQALWKAAVAECAHLSGDPEWPSLAAGDRSWLRWNDGLVVRMARAINEEGRFDDLPVLADALEDAGCSDEAILTHCRKQGPHVRGCWVVDLLVGKE
jgi:serine/threonine protein kinase